MDQAKSIICIRRNSNEVENEYLDLQLRITIEIYSKEGAEGQTGHGENGISRSYEAGDISPSLLGQITPFATTPFSTVRVVNV